MFNVKRQQKVKAKAEVWMFSFHMPCLRRDPSPPRFAFRPSLAPTAKRMFCR